MANADEGIESEFRPVSTVIMALSAVSAANTLTAAGMYAEYVEHAKKKRRQTARKCGFDACPRPFRCRSAPAVAAVVSKGFLVFPFFGSFHACVCVCMYVCVCVCVFVCVCVGVLY